MMTQISQAASRSLFILLNKIQHRQNRAAEGSGHRWCFWQPQSLNITVCMNGKWLAIQEKTKFYKLKSLLKSLWIIFKRIGAVFESPGHQMAWDQEGTYVLTGPSVENCAHLWFQGLLCWNTKKKKTQTQQKKQWLTQPVARCSLFNPLYQQSNKLTSFVQFA